MSSSHCNYNGKWIEGYVTKMGQMWLATCWNVGTVTKLGAYLVLEWLSNRDKYGEVGKA